MIQIGTIVMGADRLDRAIEFWSAALGYDIVRFDDADDGFTILVPPSRVGTRLGLHRSAVPVQSPPRIHLDVTVEDASEQEAEIRRLVGLGATRLEWDYPDDPDFVVLADTEGNPFCVVNKRHGQAAED